METLDKLLLKVLTTSTRQEIVKLLAKRPYTASELSKILDKHVTTIAEHLEVLEKSGLVYRKEGSKWVYYKLTPKGENIFRPNYSWAIVFSLSVVGLFVGAFLYTSSNAAYIAEQASKALPQAPASQPAQAININILFGLIFIALAVAGIAYLVIKHVRAKTLRNQSLYIK